MTRRLGILGPHGSKPGVICAPGKGLSLLVTISGVLLVSLGLSLPTVVCCDSGSPWLGRAQLLVWYGGGVL